MSNHPSRIILLCEDDAHERLARAFLEECGVRNLERILRSSNASRLQKGGGAQWVLKSFPEQLQACRRRHAKTLLIVMVDADNLTVEERRRELLHRLKACDLKELSKDEPVALVIPKRNVETWIAALQGNKVNEDENCKTRAKLTREDYRQAAKTLFAWSRTNATPGPTCISSLQAALPEWRRIG